jgi:hypothetical protein
MTCFHREEDSIQSIALVTDSSSRSAGYLTDSPEARGRKQWRGNRSVSQEYAQLKQRLATAHPFDIEAYMDGKEEFIRQTEAKALEWVSRRDTFETGRREPQILVRAAKL